jgi:hypothetical protein
MITQQSFLVLCLATSATVKPFYPELEPTD